MLEHHIGLRNKNLLCRTIHHLVPAFSNLCVFDLSENFKLKPHTLIKYALDAPISYDVNANLFMYDLIEVGVGYRVDDSFSGMINFQLVDNLRIGYAYDAIRSDLDIVTNSSHEIFINFDITFSTKVSRSPRYF